MIKQVLAIVAITLSLWGCHSNTERLLGTWVGDCMGKTDTIMISKTLTEGEYEINVNGTKRNGKISNNELLVPVGDIYLELKYDNETNKLNLKEGTITCRFERKLTNPEKK